jgi:hypothetical protein
LTVPTVTFQTLYVFIVLSLERRVLLHVNATRHPTAAWTALQMVAALGPDSATVRRVIRDRDGIYGAVQQAGPESRSAAASHRTAITMAERLRGAVRGHAAA